MKYEITGSKDQLLKPSHDDGGYDVAAGDLALPQHPGKRAMNATRTPVDSIKIPAEYMELCHEWYSGKDDLLYAISSTGGLTRGNQRPYEWTDEQWYLSLWQELSVDVMHARRSAEKMAERAGNDPEIDNDTMALAAFEKWVDKIVEKLAREYDLEEWEA
jgi:hypothetical protein